MIRIFFKSVLTLVLISSFSISLFAATVENVNYDRSRFFVDYVSFTGENGVNRLEVYYKIFNNGLKYLKKGDQYIADYEINVIVLGDKDRQINGRSVERSYVLADYALTESEDGFLINHIGLLIPPGKYKLITKLIDHNSNLVSTIESEFKSPEFSTRADISEILLIRKTADVSENSPFYHDGVTAVPSVETILDNEKTQLGYYAEIYPGKYADDNLELEYRLTSKNNHEDFQPIAFLRHDDGWYSVKDFVDLTEFLPADYKLTLRLKRKNKVIAKRTTKFIIKWSIKSLVTKDFDYALRQLKYLITRDEKKELEEVPDSLQSQAFFDWWVTKDPSPETKENELKDEYYRRIRYANRYYAAINREGWETDRGMVYVRYGEPDQIDNHPFELGQKPYKIWYYYLQRRTFVFEDLRGDGDYQLRYPYDGDWRGYTGP